MNFHCNLNCIEPSIQFTLETESEGQLAFLDVLISGNQDGSNDTTVYRKPTHTNKYLDFSSHHPLAHKISVVRTLYSRARALTSSAVTRTHEQHFQSLNPEWLPSHFYSPPSSHHPLAHKISVVRTLYSRARALTSSAVTRTHEQHFQSLNPEWLPSHFYSPPFPTLA